MEEAKKRDHRVLGKKLDLFSIQEDAGGGLVFWHPKGSAIRRGMEEFWKDAHENSDKPYLLLYTPHIANLDLWKTSGHFDFYQEGMFDQMEVEGDQFQIKPMNCLFHCLVCARTRFGPTVTCPSAGRSCGTVYRNAERSGTLHGLFRVRGFTRTTRTSSAPLEQLTDEILGVWT